MLYGYLYIPCLAPRLLNQPTMDQKESNLYFNFYESHVLPLNYDPIIEMVKVILAVITFYIMGDEAIISIPFLFYL